VPTADTKTTILDAAETVFAEYGYDAASMRALTTRAGVNLAAINYHFGGKAKLATAALARRLGPINAERQRRLTALPRDPAIADVVRAFVAPVFPSARGDGIGPGTAFCRMFGRFLMEQPAFLQRFLTSQFRDLGGRFVAVLRTQLPGHAPATMWWRLFFMVGAMAHTLHSSHTLTHLTGGLCDDEDVEAIVEQLVAFAAAGIAADGTPRRSRGSVSGKTSGKTSRTRPSGPVRQRASR
jgi:AcrR family transcriptional regulator